MRFIGAFYALEAAEFFFTFSTPGYFCGSVLEGAFHHAF
jgi:hypothetical protein